jgi:hypothetical protein
MSIDKEVLIYKHSRLVGDFHQQIVLARDFGLTSIDKLFEMDDSVLYSLFKVDGTCLSDMLHLMRNIQHALLDDGELYLHESEESFAIVDSAKGAYIKCLDDSDLTRILDVANKPFVYYNEHKDAIDSRDIHCLPTEYITWSAISRSSKKELRSIFDELYFFYFEEN